MSWVKSLGEFSFLSALLRLLLAALTGAVIGYGQTQRGRSAGMRTFMLVCTGAALTVLISQYLYAGFQSFWADALKQVDLKFDGSRYAAGVVAGVGFLAAGSIIGVGHQQVSGLGSAVGLFVTACLGLAAGAGFYVGLIPGLIVVGTLMAAIFWYSRSIQTALRDYSRK